MANALNKVNSGGIEDGSIVNADVKSDAAIDGSKIVPDFGSQNIVTTGNTGLGAAPSTGYQLQVTGQSGYDDVARITGVGTNIGPRLNFTPTGTGNARINATANDLKLQTAGTTGLTIDTSQNVGIGTTSPSAKLHVNSGTANTCATFQSTDSGAGINLTDDSARSSLEQNGTSLKISSDTDDGDADSDIRLQVDGGTKVKVDSTGDLTISDGDLVIGTAGHGIDFSAQTPSSSTGASATGEVLIHYEFGTWTPVVKLGTTVNSGTVSGAVYTRIGNLVTVQCTVTSITESGTGNLSVHGMPFDRAHGDPTGFCRWAGISTNGTAWPYIASTTVEFQNGGDDGYVGALSDSNTSATYHLYSLQLVYHC